MKKVLATALAIMMIAGVSIAGQLTPGLDSLIQTMKGSDEIKVLVVLKDRVDIESLNWELRADRASLPVRHETVVTALQNKAAATQGALLAELDAMRGNGKLLGYTPHWLINAVVVTTTVDELPRLAARDDVDVIEVDLVVELIEPVSAPKAKNKSARGIGIAPGVVDVGARRIWDELGIDGTGALVGVLDTGVQGTHSALSSNYRGNNGYPHSESWFDAAGLGDTTPIDQHYHGTHVMGTICGLADDDTIGVAPGAQWIASNVINMSAGEAFDNAVIASLEFMTDPDGDPGTTHDVPDVVQNSWGVNEGFAGYFDCDTRWWVAIDACEAAGVVLTWSAGNEGSGSETLRSPADRAESLFNTFSVGSTNHTAPYVISGFSSRGPSGCGGAYAMKPEISAPGADIYSAEPGGGYQYLSGTSMAGPHIAGVVALMRSANPGLDVETVKQILMDTAIDLGATGEDNDYGHGFVDGYAAVLAVMSGYGTVDGTVTDLVTTLPINGATVTFSAAGEVSRTATTNTSGYFNKMLPQGDWTLDYAAFGYIPDSQPATVVEDLVTTADMALDQAPSALLSGHVYDDEAAPVDGAAITVLGTPLAPATSRVDGYYEIIVPTGTVYDVLASAYGMGSQQVPLDIQGNTTQDFTLPQLIFENFESNSLTVFPWVTSGNADWFTTTDEVYEGNYSVKSGNISDNGASVLSVTMDVLAAGNIEFYYKVSSESNYDYLRFAIDGAQQGEWAGEINWALASYSVTAGSHTFTWTYDKDGSVSTGGDCAWVDYVVFPTITPPTYPEMVVSPLSLEVSLSPGEMATRHIDIDNIGEGDLLYSANANADLPGKAADNDEPYELGKDDPDPRVGQSPLLGSGGPDGFGYNWVDSDEFGGPAYDWVEINTLGTALSLSDDDISTNLPLGFTFKFYGTDFTTVKVCSNGFLSFTSNTTSYTNSAIPTSGEPNNLIAAYWDDLNPASSGTVYYYADTANNRFIVEWDAVVHYGTSDPQTFQVILYRDHTILFQYADTNDQTYATVGIENAGGTDGLQVVFNATYIHDGLATLFSFVPPPDPWLVVTPNSGTIPGPTTGAQLEVVFDATLLSVGVYTGSVVISGNDPDSPQVVVPVTLTVDDQTAVGDLPSTFALGAAYPNPFNPSTKIAYAIPAGGGRVDLKIFDLSGRLVRTLVSGEMPAGNHTAVWTGLNDAGRRVASGTYFYRLQAPDFDDTRKMVLVK